MLAPNDGLAPHHCHQQNGLRALSPQTGKWHPRSYSAVKTWQDCRKEWWLSSSAILCHFTFIRYLGHQPTVAWQPHKPERWLRHWCCIGGVKPPEGGHYSALALVVLRECGSLFLDLQGILSLWEMLLFLEVRSMVPGMRWALNRYP